MNINLEQIWANTDQATKIAFHRCTCLSSTNPTDLALVREFIAKIENRLKN